MELRDVYNELHPFASKWVEIGISLGLTSSILEEIRENHSNAQSCLREVLVVWLKGNGLTVTWKKLIDALILCGEMTVAQSLRAKYDTGNFFVNFHTC